MKTLMALAIFASTVSGCVVVKPAPAHSRSVQGSTHRHQHCHKHKKHKTCHEHPHHHPHH